ncbi:MFS transporter [Nocardia suismassiliense]|uniref:MFS transporter n=1 Tax=Nocardia suismassiliense TaxID=2077092 RepID=A0ABW6QMF1_9NOCA
MTDTKDSSDRRSDDFSNAPIPERSIGRRLETVLAIDHLLGSSGFFTLFPVLGVLLATQTTGVAIVGIGLACYTASSGFASFLVNRWLLTVPFRVGMAAGTAVSGVSFGALAYVHSGWMLCLLLICAGFGVSVHYMLSRVLIADAVSSSIEQHRIFSVLQIAVNAAATLGPFVANVLFFRDPRLLTSFIAVCYFAAGTVIFLGGPREQRVKSSAMGWPVSLRTIKFSVSTPEIWRVLLMTALGAVAYAQFYSAFSIYVSIDFDSGFARSALVGAVPVIIVCAQSSISRIVTTYMKRGAVPLTILGWGAALFGIAMIVLGTGLPHLLRAISTVLIFAVAEMVFTPMMSTAFAGLPMTSSLEAFNLRQIFWAGGQALGSLAGGSLFLALYRQDAGSSYWLVLGITTTLLAIPLGSLLRHLRSRTAAQSPDP